ncbi:MAG TPA: RHS repeat-associated core domain-containing protein [Ignavibacteria bacterium]
MFEKYNNSPIVSYIYDKNGNLETVTGGTSVVTDTITRKYDRLNRVVSKNTSIRDVEYLYDSVVGSDKIAEIAVQKSKTDGSTENKVTKVFDSEDRLVEVYDTMDGYQKQIASYTYYPSGSLKKLESMNGSNIVACAEYQYYKDSRVYKITNAWNGTAPKETYVYTYDDADNLKTKSDPKTINNTSYMYDSMNRLKNINEYITINGRPTARITDYTFDAAGNRLTETTTIDGVVTTTTYNYVQTTNRLKNKTAHGESGIVVKRGTQFVEESDCTYDANGNLSQIIKKNYLNNKQYKTDNTYDFDRLQNTKLYEWNSGTSSYVLQNSIDYKYNGDGYRNEMVIDGVITRYMYEADKVILEVDSTGREKARNIYGINLLKRSADSLATSSIKDTYYYMYNGHADVTALIDPYGILAGTYYYDAFGNILERTGNANNNITYAGYQYDEKTKLYYLNARFYDPLTARFIQEDSYYGDINDPLSLNLYIYCHNEPMMYDDPTGHMNYATQTGDLLKGAGDRLIGDIKDLITSPWTLLCLGKELLFGDMDLGQLAKSMFDGLTEDFRYVISNAGLLKPELWSSYSDKEVRKMGYHLTGVITTVVQTFAGGAIGAKLVSVLSKTKSGAKLLKTLNKVKKAADDVPNKVIQKTASFIASKSDDAGYYAKKYASEAAERAEMLSQGSHYAEKVTSSVSKKTKGNTRKVTKKGASSKPTKKSQGKSKAKSSSSSSKSSSKKSSSKSSSTKADPDIDESAKKLLNDNEPKIGGMCFTAETLVKVKEGFKEIISVRPGDLVYSENTDTGEKGYKAVKQLFVSKTGTLIQLTVKDKVIRTTKPHPFYVSGKGWVEAEYLKAGDVYWFIIPAPILVWRRMQAVVAQIQIFMSDLKAM